MKKSLILRNAQPNKPGLVAMWLMGTSQLWRSLCTILLSAWGLIADTLTSQTAEKPVKRVPLPKHTQTLLLEGLCLIGAVVILYVSMSLLTYTASDPGFFHSYSSNRIMNWGGGVGAYLSDGLYALFGWSCWWVVASLTVLCVKRVQHLNFLMRDQGDNKPANEETSCRMAAHFLDRYMAPFGMILVLLGSCGLEYLISLRLGSHMNRTPGGSTGGLAGAWISMQFGVIGATLLFLSTAIIGLSLLFNGSVLSGVLHIQQGLIRAIDAIDQRGAPQKDEAEPVVINIHLDRGSSIDASKIRKNLVSPTPRSYVADVKSFAAIDIIPKSTSTSRATDQKVRKEPTMEHIRENATNCPSAISVIKKLKNPKLTTDSQTRNAQESDECQRSQNAVEPDKRVMAAVTKPSARKTSVYGCSMPSLELLDAAAATIDTVNEASLLATGELIETRLSEFGVAVKIVGAFPGPVITRYEIAPANGVKGSQIVGLARDLSRALSLTSIRVVEVIPGKTTMGLELPNARREIVRLTEILDSDVYRNNPSMLTIALGKDIAGKPVVADLAKMPHLLIAGTTGSGKSVGINATILSLLYKADPSDVRLILIDPKMLELSIYEGIPHLLTPVVTDMKLAAQALNWAVEEMERRYKVMSKLGVRNLAGHNQKIADAAQDQPITNPFSLTPDAPEALSKLPNIVIIIDELADLMMVAGKKVEELIARIAQKARAAGIHLILATQRPSVDVITGLIKANVPTRMAFQVSSKIDSRTILDQMGAEALLGMGDMLYMPPGTGSPVRIHGAFVSDEEVHRVVAFLKSQGEPNYVASVFEQHAASLLNDSAATNGEKAASDGGEDDELYLSAVEVVMKNKKASISLVQRHLRIGYNRAARLLELMEQRGRVSVMKSNGNRDILTIADDSNQGV